MCRLISNIHSMISWGQVPVRKIKQSRVIWRADGGGGGSHRFK